ncbi:MAG: hypothetical protein D6724_07850 [Armatimonadetes bacterium]|nr:MAG: hypothetical protein D6724_07850 [Armatimonadota bacterium]
MTDNLKYEIQRCGPADGPTNMAKDLDLEGGRPAVRIYTWAEPWVTLGRFQQADAALKPGCRVPWVKRPTGGKAVLHGHDLTLGIFVPAEPGRLSVKSAYRLLISPIVEGLNRAGIRAALGENTAFLTRALRTADCFRHISPNDVVDPATGRKLVGCALRIGPNGVLAQCSIPIAPPLVDPGEVFTEPHEFRPLPRNLSPADLADALEAAFAGRSAPLA